MPDDRPHFFGLFARSLAVLSLVAAVSASSLALVGSAFAAPLGSLTPSAAPGGSARANSGGAAQPAPEEKIAADSPRAALTDFNRLTRAAEYSKAARYLDLSAVDQSDGPILSKHLREVLDRHLWIDVDKLSADSHGNGDDGLAPDREELGNVPGAAGKPEPVVIVRRVDRLGARWVFSATTVAQIDAWYEHLENRWLLEHLPKWALLFGPHELRWWQWLALGPMLLAGWLVGFVITRASRFVIRRVMQEHSVETARKLRGPATLAWLIATCYALLPWLGLYEPADAYVRRWFSAALLVAFFWALWKAVELSQHTWSTAHWARNSLTAASLLNLGARMGKFVVAAFAFVAVLAELGYPVTSIITGLGIGGVALALAAQKTVENLFGAFSLAIDQPFREGDVIQVDSVTGTVESIGLRSTRIRTQDQTVISIPNGKLAEMRVETISARRQIRFYCVLGLAHSSSQQMAQILGDIESVLRATPETVKDGLSVRFIGLTDSAMNVEVAVMIATSDYAKFSEIRQNLLLRIVEAVERADGALAHPMHSVELVDRASTELVKARTTPGT